MPSKTPKGTRKKKYNLSPRMAMFLAGEISIEDLDDEEIRRGQFRCANGTFQGRPSDMLPRKFYDALVAEQMKRWQQKVREELEPSLKILTEIRDNPRAQADARYKSAVYIIERAVGKVPEKSEVKMEVSEFEKDIEDIVVD